MNRFHSAGPTSASSASSASFRSPARSDLRLRTVLRLNSVSSGLGGLVAAVAPGTLDDWLDTGRPGWVRAIGVGLVGFAVAVLITSTARTARLRRWTPPIIAGDVSWVVGSLVTIGLDWYSTTGDLVVGAVASMVATWATLQAVTWRRLASVHRSG